MEQGADAKNRPSDIKSRHDDETRRRLAYSTVILMGFSILAFILTNNIAAVLGTSTVGIAVTFVFRYYFQKKSDDGTEQDG